MCVEGEVGDLLHFHTTTVIVRKKVIMELNTPAVKVTVFQVCNPKRSAADK